MSVCLFHPHRDEIEPKIESYIFIEKTHPLNTLRIYKTLFNTVCVVAGLTLYLSAEGSSCNCPEQWLSPTSAGCFTKDVIVVLTWIFPMETRKGTGW